MLMLMLTLMLMLMLAIYGPCRSRCRLSHAANHKTFYSQKAIAARLQVCLPAGSARLAAASVLQMRGSGQRSAQNDVYTMQVACTFDRDGDVQQRDAVAVTLCKNYISQLTLHS